MRLKKPWRIFYVLKNLDPFYGSLDPFLSWKAVEGLKQRCDQINLVMEIDYEGRNKGD